MHMKLLFAMTSPTSYLSDSNFTDVLPMLCTSHTNLEVKIRIKDETALN